MGRTRKSKGNTKGFAQKAHLQRLKRVSGDASLINILLAAQQLIQLGWLVFKDNLLPGSIEEKEVRDNKKMLLKADAARRLGKIIDKRAMGHLGPIFHDVSRKTSKKINGAWQPAEVSSQFKEKDRILQVN